MKILMLANNDIGLYKFRKELIERLVNDGNQLIASIPYGDMVSDIEELGCRCIKTEFNRRGTNPIDDMVLIKQYLFIVGKEKPDMVLTYTIKPNVYGGMVCQLKGIPYISNITGLGTSVEYDGILQRLTLGLYKIGLRKAKCVFFQNEDNMRLFASRKIVTGKSRLIPGSGVNLDMYQPCPYPDEEAIDFLFAARIMKEKGIDQYLDAASEIKSRYTQTRFHICGICEEDYKPRLEAMTSQGTIIYHGLVNDMKSMYAACHCTVHPTYYPEGLSNVLLENCATARPIITTNRSGCREVVDDGVNGYVVEEKNSADLIIKIEKFLRMSRTEREGMGLAGRAKIESKFDREIVIRAYIEEIGEIAT